MWIAFTVVRASLLLEYCKLTVIIIIIMRGDRKAASAISSGKSCPLGSAAFSSVDAVDMISFDFQQNLPTPNLQHNDVFYARQLWTYNFGIHDCVADKGYMYRWDETIAKHGSAEVASCLKHFFQVYPTGAKSLVSFLRWMWWAKQKLNHRWLVQ